MGNTQNVPKKTGVATSPVINAAGADITVHEQNGNTHLKKKGRGPSPSPSKISKRNAENGTGDPNKLSEPGAGDASPLTPMGVRRKRMQELTEQRPIPSEENMVIVRDTWSTLEKDIDGLGTDLFVR